MPKSSAGAAPAKLIFATNEVISLKSHRAYDEIWLEKQIKADSSLLGLLGKVVVTHREKPHKNAGRLDLIAEDEENQYRYIIELMLGSLDPSHITRIIEYWLREKEKEQREGWETVAVLVAEHIRDSRFYDVVQFLSEKMPIVIVEMRALRVENLLTLNFTKLFDGRDQLTLEPPETQRPDMDEKAWENKSSFDSIEVVRKLGTILEGVENDINLNWQNQQFVGITVGNIALNFVTFHPKKHFVRVHARSLVDTDKWAAKLKRAGFEMLGGTPGKTIHFRVDKAHLQGNISLLKDLFNQCYETRIAA